MAITQEQLAALHPRLYHMADVDSWPSIKRHGLLSTTALLDLFEIEGQRRNQLERSLRKVGTTITHPRHGTAVLRDQSPMDESGLIRALTGTGLTPADWLVTLNRRVFFWLTEERLLRMLTAANYRDTEHLVLVVDTARLLERHWRNVTLSPINSGATKPMPAPRGPGTFQSPADFPFDSIAARRRRNDVVVELAVDRAVAAIDELVIDVRRQQRDAIVEQVM